MPVNSLASYSTHRPEVRREDVSSQEGREVLHVAEGGTHAHKLSGRTGEQDFGQTGL